VLLLTGWGDDITPPTNAAALKHMLLKTAEVIALFETDLRLCVFCL